MSTPPVVARSRAVALRNPLRAPPWMSGRKSDRRPTCCFSEQGVEEEPWRHAEAVTHTAALMSDERVPAIFEAAFEYEDIRIRVDVLEQLAPGTWGLREVKSSSGLKDHYLDDIALQTYVLRGVAVSSMDCST